MEKLVLPFASQGSRALNSIVDNIIVLLLLFLLSIGLILVKYHNMMADIDTNEALAMTPILFFPINFLYYFLMELKYQRTIGKFITKTKVVTKQGIKPSPSKIALRTLYRFIPFEYLSFLFSTQGIHDLLSGTCVVKWYA